MTPKATVGSTRCHRSTLRFVNRLLAGLASLIKLRDFNFRDASD